MLNVGKKGAEKIGEKRAILAGLPRGGLLEYRIGVRESRKVVDLYVKC